MKANTPSSYKPCPPCFQSLHCKIPPAPVPVTQELVSHQHRQSRNLSKPPPWRLKPGHEASQLPPLQQSYDETDLKAEQEMCHNASSPWGSRFIMLRLEGTAVCSGPTSGFHDQPPHHIGLILGKQTGAVPSRMIPGHLIPGLARNPRRQTRTCTAWRPQTPQGVTYIECGGSWRGNTGFPWGLKRGTLPWDCPCSAKTTNLDTQTAMG